MRVYLLRHAESESQEDIKILLEKLDRDLGLTEKGNIQRHKVADWFSDHLKPHASSSGFKLHMKRSPYHRTILTSETTIAKLGLKKDGGVIESISDHEILTERILGKFGGYSREELATHFPDEYKKFEHEIASLGIYDTNFPDGESFRDVEKRMDQFIPEIQQAAKDGVSDLIIVGHSRALSILHKQLTKQSVDDYLAKQDFGNCHVRMLEVTSELDVTDHGFVYSPSHESAARMGTGKRVLGG